MKKLVTICLYLGVALILALMPPANPLPATVTAAAEIAGGSNTAFSEQRNVFTHNGKTRQYLLVFPAEYARDTRHWPLILFLHGSSGRGLNLDLVKQYGPPLIAEQHPSFPFVVLAPQCPEEEYWTDNADLLAALLDDVLARYRLDRDRVYLTGTSMGGNGVWHLAARHPQYFAAIAPSPPARPFPPSGRNSFLLCQSGLFTAKKTPYVPWRPTKP